MPCQLTHVPFRFSHSTSHSTSHKTGRDFAPIPIANIARIYEKPKNNYGKESQSEKRDDGITFVVHWIDEKRKRPSPKIELPADISGLISGYEKDSREAEAKLSDARKKAARKAKAKPLNE